MPRPSCGPNKPPSGPSATDIVGGIFAAAGTIGSIIAAVSKAAAAPWAAAAVAVVIVIAIILYFTLERCDRNPSGKQGCMAGVIENIQPAFTGSVTDHVFPFTSQHDRVDVVVKKDYWDEIDSLSPYVYCS